MNKEFQRMLEVDQTPEEREQALLGGCPNHHNAWYDCGWPTMTPEDCGKLGCCWDPTSPSNFCYYKTRPLIERTMSNWAAVKEILRATWANNQGEALNVHPEMSRWWQWPLLLCNLVVYGDGMYSMGNVVVWWMVAAVEAFTAGILPLYLIARGWSRLGNGPAAKRSDVLLTAPTAKAPLPASLNILALLLGYIGCWAPFHYIVRSTWNYHYMLALFLGVTLCGLYSDLLLKKMQRKNMAWVAKTLLLFLMALMVAAFWYWAPWTYGFTLNAEETAQRMWWAQWATHEPFRIPWPLSLVL